MTSLGARSKCVLGAKAAAAQPSPLAGEGDATASGEGGAARSNPCRDPLRDTARKLRRSMTDAERKLWGLLRNRRLVGCKFRRQVPIGPYVVDFVSYPTRLIVEVDGSQHAESVSDADRDAWLTSQNFRVLRFWNSDIFGNPEGVLIRVVKAGSSQHHEATP